MDAVRRDEDGELCGHVAQDADGSWRALTVFGAPIGRHAERDAAVDHVRVGGLASLAERWTLRHVPSGDEEIVCIQEADPGQVTVVLGYYALPGVPTRSLTAEQLSSGEWELYR